MSGSTPNASIAELQLLACALADQAILPSINAEWFEDGKNAVVLSAIEALSKAGVPITGAALEAFLETKGNLQTVGGGKALAELASMPIRLDQVPFWCGLLRERAMRRQAVAAISQLQGLASDPSKSSRQLIEQMQERLLKLQESTPHAEESNPAVLDRIDAEIQQAAANGGALRGLETGLACLDDITNGLGAGQLFTLAGRPGSGKSALAMNIADHVAVNQHRPVAVFSLEMPRRALLLRMICARSRTSFRDAERGRLSAEELMRWKKAKAEIAQAPLFILDDAGLGIEKIHSHASRLLKRHGVELAIIDYVQRIRPRTSRRNSSRYEEMTEISNQIADMARALNIPVVSLCQMNREAEREGRKPRPTDLRDTGAIEQDADIIGLLHAPSDAVELNGKRQVSLIIAKNRNGPMDEISLEFDPAPMRFACGAGCSRA